MLVRVCPDCSHHNQAEAWYCAQCGRTLAEKTAVELSSIIATDAESNNQITQSDELDLPHATTSKEINPLSYANLESDIWSDISRFSKITFNKNSNVSYRNIGDHGTLKRILSLVLTIEILTILGMILFIGSNPYISLGTHLSHLSFDIAIVFLGITGFFTQTTLQFISFRLFGGKGTVIAHAYLTILSSIHYFGVLIVAVFLGGFSEGLSNIVLIISNILLIVLWFISLQDLHHISFIRAMSATVLGILVSIPCIFAAIYLFGFFQVSYPYEIYDWRTSVIFDVMLIFLVSALSYMMREDVDIPKYVHQEGKLDQYRNRQKNFTLLTISVAVIALSIFLYLDTRYTTVQTKLPPYHVTFLPGIDDLLFVATHKEEFRGPTLVEEWSLSQSHRTNTFEFGFMAARMRPSSNGDSLVLSDRQSPHGDATIFNPMTGERSSGRFSYLEDYGIANPERKEFYITSSSGGIRIGQMGAYVSSSSEGIHIEHDRNDDLIRVALPRNKRAYSVTVHPNNKFLFIIGDNYIDVMDLDSRQVIDTLHIGGKLRDLAISPDGQTLYIADSLWKRVIIMPFSVLGLDSVELNINHETGGETATETSIPDECDPDSIICMHSFTIEIVSPNTLIIGFSIQPLQDTTISENLFFSADIMVGITHDPKSTASSDHLGTKQFKFTCTSNLGEDVQQCKSAPVEFSDSPGKLDQGEKICFEFFSFMPVNKKHTHCFEQP